MKKSIVILLVFVSIFAFVACQGKKQKSSTIDNKAVEEKKPFENLVKDEIQEVKVYVSPSNVQHTLSEDEITEFVSILNEIIIYEQIPSEDLSGGVVRYTIKKSDGSTLKIEGMGTYFTIDEVWYRAEYETSEALTQFGQNVTDTEFSNKNKK